MTSSLTRLIEQEDPRQPYTDEQLAQMLGIRREQVVELRRTAGVADSRTRLRPILTRELARLLAQEPDLSDRSLTARLNESGFKVSRYLVRELRETLPPAPGPVTAAAEPPAPQEAEENLFARMIGFDGGLKAQIHQVKAAVSYPPNGLHTLIIGPSGSGKTLLAETMYRYAIQQKLLAPDAPFVAFNCADYADNPQLLNSQLFGYVRGAFSGATTTRSGLVDKADGGILFLDEIHRLSGEGQEMLFYLLDKGAFRRLGDSGPAHQVKVRLIAATTSSPESALLLTFRRRIPIVISMPALADRPLSERFAVVQSILETEYRKIGRRLVVEREAARLLLQYDCPGNIGQLQSDIQVCCANAFLESVSRQEDAVYIRAELVQQLLPAVTGSRTLEIESQYDRQLVFPPGDAEPPVEAEPDELYKRLKEAVDSDDSSPERIRGLLNQFIHPGPRVLQEAAEAAEVRRRKHQETLALVRTVLADMQDCLLCLGGDFEESVALCLTSQGPHGDPTDTAHLADKYPAEYELARRFASKYCALRPSNLSAYQIQMLTLCLYAFSARRTGKRIRIILMAHGQVGPAMAEVVNHILQDDNAIGFSMDWQESSEQVLERAIRLVQQVDEGLGCLLLVDMGSLASFAPEISLRTGKPSAILTVCITGEGYARRIESFLKATVVECRDIKIVDVGLLNRDAMLARVEELRHDYDIVAAVGTINPELPGIPFLPMNYIFSGQGTMALTNLLESHCQRPNGLGDLLDPQLILCDADFNDKNDALDTLCTMLTEKGCVKPDFLLSVYKRENLGATCLPQQIAIPHGDPALVTKPAICIAKTCRPVDWSGGFVAEIVFLFALDESCQIFVQRFCDLLKDENRVKALLSAKSAQEIYDLLR